MICDSSCSSVIPKADKGTWEGHFRATEEKLSSASLCLSARPPRWRWDGQGWPVALVLGVSWSSWFPGEWVNDTAVLELLSIGLEMLGKCSEPLSPQQAHFLGASAWWSPSGLVSFRLVSSCPLVMLASEWLLGVRLVQPHPIWA